MVEDSDVDGVVFKRKLKVANNEIDTAVFSSLAKKI